MFWWLFYIFYLIGFIFTAPKQRNSPSKSNNIINDLMKLLKSEG